MLTTPLRNSHAFIHIRVVSLDQLFIPRYVWRLYERRRQRQHWSRVGRLTSKKSSRNDLAAMRRPAVWPNLLPNPSHVLDKNTVFARV